MKPLIDTLKIFESNMGLTALMQGLIDHVAFQLDSQVRFHEDSVSEVLISMTETFSKAETENFKQRVSKASAKSYSKFLKYFHEESGLHPARKFIFVAQFLNPKTALKFNIRPELTAIPDFEDIPDAEFSGYRQLCRNVCTITENNFTLEDLRKENESIKDFWVGCETNLPNLSRVALTYGLLVCSSACVDRIFTYYNKVLSPDRANLKPETLKQLMFLYCNTELS